MTKQKLIKVNFCIPPLGTKIVLAKPWTFDLYYERRNESLIDTLCLRKKVFGPEETRIGRRWTPSQRPPQYNSTYRTFSNDGGYEDYEYKYTPESWEWASGCNAKIKKDDIIKAVTLPRGCVLSVQRIYIRCGVKYFDSVTFTLIKPKKKRGSPDPPHGRFWAKLHDVNKIVCYPIGSNPKVEASFGHPEVSHLKTFRFLDLGEDPGAV